MITRSSSGLLAGTVHRLVTLLVVTLAFALYPHIAYAAAITVDGAACTLPDAITAANTDATTGGCTAGSGADTILLTASTYSLATGPYNYDGMTATPSVTTTIVISGGVDGAIVERSGAELYRLLHVGTTGDLTLENIVVRYGNVGRSEGAIIERSGAEVNRLFHDGTSVDLSLENVAEHEAEVYGNGGAIFNRGKLTLVGCQLFSNSARDGGGGIFNVLASTLILTNSDFISNTAWVGGGIYNTDHSTLTLADSHFISNTAYEGGGIYNTDYSTATFSNSSLTANKATEYGGGIVNYYGTLTSIDSNFIFNKAGSSGGGIYNIEQSALTLTNSYLISNSADDYGGGLVNYASTATLTGSDFISNSAGSGGGLSIRFSTTTVTDITFIANTAIGGGGAIANVESTTTIVDSNFIDNKASTGGGIINYRGTITLTNSEIRANLAKSSGGGLYQEDGLSDDTQASATIIGSRFLNNMAGDTGAALLIGGEANVSQSCIVNNTNTAIDHVGNGSILASNNWWGAPDGPSGAGPGVGDSVSDRVSFRPFLTNAPMGCPLRTVETRYLPLVERQIATTTIRGRMH